MLKGSPLSSNSLCHLSHLWVAKELREHLSNRPITGAYEMVQPRGKGRVWGWDVQGCGVCVRHATCESGMLSAAICSGFGVGMSKGCGICEHIRFCE